MYKETRVKQTFIHNYTICASLILLIVYRYSKYKAVRNKMGSKEHWFRINLCARYFCR